MPSGYSTCSNCGCVIASSKMRAHQAECCGLSESNIPDGDNAEWVPMVNHPEYEMLNEYPYSIRRIDKPERILDERINNHGYVVVNLLKKPYLKHRLIAEQFLPNPQNLPVCDHVNHDKTDYHIENLRWTTQQQNSNNRYDQEFFDDIPDDSIVVDRYGDWEFDFLYYNEERDEFYFFNGRNYALRTVYLDKRGRYRIKATDVTGKQHTIYLNKFKRDYGLI